MESKIKSAAEKNERIALNQRLNVKELKMFGNMSAREPCFRCEGSGFRHESTEKHMEKSIHTRCKKCVACVGMF